MLFTKKNIFPLSVLILLLSACQKKDDNLTLNDPNPVINLALEGDFYGERLRSGGFSDIFTTMYANWKDTTDVLINCSLEGDTLKVLGFDLKVDSMDQMVFMYADGVGPTGVTSISVRYANNYDSVYIEYKTPCGSAGNCSTINYAAKKGGSVSLPRSGMNYRLQVHRRRTHLVVPGPIVTLIDTHYINDIVINHQTPYVRPFAADLSTLQLNLESTNFELKGFESYYNHKKEENHDDLYQQVYWKNDSFYLEHQLLHYANGRSAPADTTYYLYKGVRR